MDISFVERQVFFDSDTEKSGWNARNGPLKWPARIMGLLSAALVIASQHTNNPTLDAVGKCFFWTAIVLPTVFVLNRDLYADIWAWAISLFLVGLQLLFVKLAWGAIGNWTFITLTPLCFLQAMLFMAPFLVLRRCRGLTYPPTEKES